MFQEGERRLTASCRQHSVQFGWGKEKIVNGEKLRVLLIGEGSGSFSGIIRRLEKTGCGCRFANSYAEARRLVQEEGFELEAIAQPSLRRS